MIISFQDGQILSFPGIEKSSWSMVIFGTAGAFLPGEIGCQSCIGGTKSSGTEETISEIGVIFVDLVGEC